MVAHYILNGSQTIFCSPGLGAGFIGQNIVRKTLIAVGTLIAEPPRTDPDVRHSRIRLLPRVLDGEALAWPGVEDARTREPVVGERRHPRPGRPILLAASPKRAPP
jgi:hypothetical protein